MAPPNPPYAAAAAARAAASRGSAAAENIFRDFGDFLDFWDFLSFFSNFNNFLIDFCGFRRFFEQLRIFGVRQMILCVILLQMHPLTALYDPFGSCYDEVPSVAGGKAAAAKPLGGEVW